MASCFLFRWVCSPAAREASYKGTFGSLLRIPGFQAMQRTTMLFTPQDCQPWPSTAGTLWQRGSHCHCKSGVPWDHASPGTCFPAQGTMVDCCFLCSCLIFKASIARRYKSGEEGSRQGLTEGLSPGVQPGTCAEQGLQGHPRLQRSALAWPPCIPPKGSHNSICLPSSPHLALQQNFFVPVSPHPAPHGQGLLHSSCPAASRPDIPPALLFNKICPGKYQPKVLETSSCCCSTAGSCDLILFLIFFFFFFFMPCTRWRNTKFQAPHQGKECICQQTSREDCCWRVCSPPTPPRISPCEDAQRCFSSCSVRLTGPGSALS